MERDAHWLEKSSPKISDISLRIGIEKLCFHQNVSDGRTDGRTFAIKSSLATKNNTFPYNFPFILPFLPDPFMKLKACCN